MVENRTTLVATIVNHEAVITYNLKVKEDEVDNHAVWRFDKDATCLVVRVEPGKVW